MKIGKKLKALLKARSMTQTRLAELTGFRQSDISDWVNDLRLVNFNSPLGTGTKAPVEIGAIEDRKFYLSFYVTAANADNSKQVMYTFYLGEKA